MWISIFSPDLLLFRPQDLRSGTITILLSTNPKATWYSTPYTWVRTKLLVARYPNTNAIVRQCFCLSLPSYSFTPLMPHLSSATKTPIMCSHFCRCPILSRQPQKWSSFYILFVLFNFIPTTLSFWLRFKFISFPIVPPYYCDHWCLPWCYCLTSSRF
jgi:hypothetical protein